jgi:hypothetical protein
VHLFRASVAERLSGSRLSLEKARSTWSWPPYAATAATRWRLPPGSACLAKSSTAANPAKSSRGYRSEVSNRKRTRCPPNNSNSRRKRTANRRPQWRPRPSCFDLPRGHHAGTKRPRMYALSVQRWSGVRRTYRIEPSRSKGRPDPSTPVGAGVALLRAGPFAYICSRESEAEARRAKNDEGRDATDPPVNAAA